MQAKSARPYKDPRMCGSYSPDLSPVNYFVWLVLESKICFAYHNSSEYQKKKNLKKDYLRSLSKSFYFTYL